MTLLRFTVVFALAGLLIPFLFRAIGYVIDQYGNLKIDLVAEKLMLVFWPTSLMVLPASPDPRFETKLFVLSVAANVTFYSVIGFLVWLGLRKHFGFFAVAAIPSVAIWWWLLTR